MVDVQEGVLSWENSFNEKSDDQRLLSSELRLIDEQGPLVTDRPGFPRTGSVDTEKK